MHWLGRDANGNGFAVRTGRRQSPADQRLHRTAKTVSEATLRKPSVFHQAPWNVIRLTSTISPNQVMWFAIPMGFRRNRYRSLGTRQERRLPRHFRMGDVPCATNRVVAGQAGRADRSLHLRQGKCEKKIRDWQKADRDALIDVPLRRWYPKDAKLPKNADTELVENLFTYRQLLQLSELYHHICKVKDPVLRDLLRYALMPHSTSATARSFPPRTASNRAVAAASFPSTATR